MGILLRRGWVDGK